MVNPITPGSPVSGSNNNGGNNSPSPPSGDSIGPSNQTMSGASPTITIPTPTHVSIAAYAELLGVTSASLIAELYGAQQLLDELLISQFIAANNAVNQTVDNIDSILLPWQSSIIPTFNDTLNTYNTGSPTTPTQTMQSKINIYQLAVATWNSSPQTPSDLATFQAAQDAYNTAATTYNTIVNNVNSAITTFNGQVTTVNDLLGTIGGFTSNETPYTDPGLTTIPMSSGIPGSPSYDGIAATPPYIISNPNSISTFTSTLVPSIASQTSRINTYSNNLKFSIFVQGLALAQQLLQLSFTLQNVNGNNISLPASYISTFPPSFSSPSSGSTIGLGTLGNAANNIQTDDSLAKTLMDSSSALYEYSLTANSIPFPDSIVHQIQFGTQQLLQLINLSASFPSLAILVHSQNSTGNALPTSDELATSPLELTTQTLVGLTTASQIAASVKSGAGLQLIANIMGTNTTGLDPTKLNSLINNLSSIQNASMIQVALGIVGQVLGIPNFVSQMVTVAQNGTSQPINPNPPTTLSDVLNNPTSLNFLKSNLSNSLAGTSGGTNLAGTQASTQQASTGSSSTSTLGSQVQGTQTAGTDAGVGAGGIGLSNAQVLVNNAVNTTVVNNPNIQTNGEFAAGLNSAFLNLGLTPSQAGALSTQAGAYVAAETLSSYLLNAEVSPGTITQEGLYNALVNPVLPTSQTRPLSRSLIESGTSINDGIVAAASVVPIGQSVATEITTIMPLNTHNSIRNLRDQLSAQLVNQGLTPTQSMVTSTQALLTALNMTPKEPPTINSLSQQIYNNTLNLLTPQLGNSTAQTMAAQTVTNVMGADAPNAAKTNASNINAVNKAQIQSMYNQLVNSINNLRTLQDNTQINRKDFQQAVQSLNNYLKPTTSLYVATQQFLSPANNLVDSMYTGMMYQGMVPHKYALPLEFMV